MSTKEGVTRSITESTLIPISLVITLLGGAFFVTYIYFQSDANAKAIEKLSAKQDVLSEMRVDIGIIKTEVESIKRKIYRR